MTRANFSEFVLGAMPGTKADIVIKSGVSQATVLRWVNQLHAERKIYICSWKRHPRAGAAMAVYAVGSLPDAPCRLKHQTKLQTRLRFEAKAKQDGRWDRMQARWRSKYWIRKAAAAGDPLVAALFGAARSQEVAP
ncbi:MULTISPECIES: hypothetical protein [unclassified Janthinobacterium]|uniref:hypothetical protein n=1 Tax=unclassified Janthinobacterium TaxID=2610881 RepID=UPI00161B4561|nr:MULTISPECIES: hypothetical protein [unclassified Janthinobacterium]MBB5610412.1 hypothetical protein [Janthinobacterium sp. S3T4]MBB5615751.1 hypothetical protein [Janthinobacterium sp. S3M3]